MRSVWATAISLALLPCFVAPPAAAGSAESVRRGKAVVREMSLAREHPERYARYLEDLKANFRGKIFLLPGGTRLLTREGVGAVKEAIRFLRSARPLPLLNSSPGLSHSAAVHVADQVSVSFGHSGSDRSDPATRMNRYGTWSGHWGENISYGKSTARDIVLALIIDDGLPNRKHRQNIFSSDFNFAGAAVGPHARYGTTCSIDFAGGYAERTEETGALFARNERLPQPE